MTDQATTTPPTPDEASTNFYWTFGKDEVFNLQTTVRGALPPEAIGLHLDSVKAALTAVVKLGGHAKPVGRQAEAPAQAAPPPPAPANGNAANPTSTSPSSPNPAVQVLHSAKLEITPVGDGKVSAKFYAAGHKYPDLYTTRPAAAILAMLAATGQWGEQHVTAAATYDVPMLIEWRESDKKNTKGNFYKDILNVKPA